MIENVGEAIKELDGVSQGPVHLAFTAHSIPLAMAKGCDYEIQLREACRIVAEGVENVTDWNLVYQSRSGPPTQPWLEPDICDHIEHLKKMKDQCKLVIVPIGFISDHMEVIYDLDTEARQLCDELDIYMIRAKTVGTHPRFVTGIRELITERVMDMPRQVLGCLGPNPDQCLPDCCLSGRPARS